MKKLLKDFKGNKYFWAGLIMTLLILFLAVLGIYSLIGMYVLKPLAMAGKIPAAVFVNSAGGEFFDFGLESLPYKTH